MLVVQYWETRSEYTKSAAIDWTVEAWLVGRAQVSARIRLHSPELGLLYDDPKSYVLDRTPTNAESIYVYMSQEICM